MKPAPFKYCVAETVDEAIALLDEHGDGAHALAGGQSLIPMMNMRLAQPDVLVDIARITTLAGIETDGALTIGAVTRQLAAERSVEVKAFASVVTEALRHVGHPAIRARGTIGGSVAHADPAAELPAILLALDGEMRVQGPNGLRTIPASDFYLDLYTTALEPGELLTHVRIPGPLRGGAAFVELARRHGDFALVGVVAAVELDAESTATSVRIAFSGVGSGPVRAREAEGFLAGKDLRDSRVLNEAGRVAAEPLEPHSDVHATSAYRKKIAGILATRALARAVGAEGRTR